MGHDRWTTEVMETPNRADRIDICELADVASPRLLRSHVRRRPDNPVCCISGQRTVQLSRQAEVRDPRIPFGIEQDILQYGTQPSSTCLPKSLTKPSCAATST